MSSDLQTLVQEAGVEPTSAQVLVGRLILENNRYDFAMRQLRKLHGRSDSYLCKCGKRLDGCPSRAVILTFDEYEKAVKT